MKFSHIILGLLLIVFTISGCTTLEVVETDAETGLFPSTKSATVLKQSRFDLDQRKEMVLAPSDGFTPAMLENIGFFTMVIEFNDLEKAIVSQNLTDKVPSISDRIGLSKAAKEYRPFLWIRWDIRRAGTADYMQLILTDPLTLDDLFVAESYMDYMWAGVNDQNNFYPLMNALIEYLDANSDSFNK